MQRALEKSIVRPRATYQRMVSNTLSLPAFHGYDSSNGNYYGGIQILRGSEGGQMTDSSPKFEQITLNLHKTYGLVYITNELLEDSAVAIEDYVTRAFIDAIAFVEDNDFLNGNGAGQPSGALDSSNPSLITVSAVSGQGANTIIYENLVDMYSRMWPEGLNNAVWLVNQEAMPELMKMSLTVGVGGIPVFLPANQAAGQPFSSLMGRNLIVTEKAQALGTAGDIAFCDFSQYLIGGKDGGEPRVGTSMHIKFDYDQMAFRFVLRYDGQSAWSDTYTPLHGTNTVSPFVVLNSTRT